MESEEAFDQSQQITDLQDINESPRLPAKLQFTLAGGLALLSFLAYMTTVYSESLPGNPANLLCYIVGCLPDFIHRHFVWKWIMRGWLSLFGGHHTVLAANIFCSAVSALGVGFFYLVCSNLFHLLFHDGGFSTTVGVDTSKIERDLSIFGGIIGSFALAFSIPYWNMATQVYFDSFYLLWLLISLFLLLRYLITFDTRYLYAFCFVHCAGISQTSCFLATAPFLFIGVGVALYLNNRLSIKILTICAFLCLLGISLIFVSAWAYYGTDGYIIQNAKGYDWLLTSIAKELIKGVTGHLPQVGWMIIVGTTVAPCAVVLISGRRSINFLNDRGMYVLNTAVFLATLFVVLNMPISPWNFFGLGAPHIVPYAMMAVAFGFSAVYMLAISYHLFEYVPEGYSHGRLVRILMRSVFVVVCLSSVVRNYEEANNRGMRFIGAYADRLINGLGGRTWIVTNGLFDGPILLRAKERGVNLNTLDLSQGLNRIVTRTIKTKLKNARLRNAAEVGLFPLVQEWISGNHNADKTLGLSLFPDLWGLGNYESYPDGLLFCGVSPENFVKLAERDLVTPYLKTLKKIDEMLPPADRKTGNRYLLAYASLVRRQVGFVGNNLGFYLEHSGRAEDAFDVYFKVHEFDQENISALLNLASMVQSGMHPDKKKAVMESLKAFRERTKTPASVWALSKTFGYVSSPEAFANMGWAWAMSGQSKLAIKSLERTLKDTKTGEKSGLQAIMAEIYDAAADRESSTAMYLEVLKEDPSNHKALLGLVKNCVVSGKYKKALEYLHVAEKAGVPHHRIIFETAIVYLLSGNINQAQVLADKLQEDSSGNPYVYLLLVEIYSAVHANAPDEKASQAAIEDIRKCVDKISELTGPQSLQTLISSGEYNKICHNYFEARENFLGAVSLSGNKIQLLTTVLEMDFALADKQSAKAHSKMILHLDSNNAYANYIMGSLSADEADYTAAEDFLQRSLDANTSLIAMNDLADVKLKLGKLDESEKLIHTIFEKNDQLYTAWDTLGCLYMERGKFNEAKAAFDKSLDIYDKDMRVFLHLAQTLFRLRKYEECRDIVRKLGAVADSFVEHDKKEYEDLTRSLLSAGK